MKKEDIPTEFNRIKADEARLQELGWIDNPAPLFVQATSIKPR
jgi:hypothetical protein